MPFTATGPWLTTGILVFAMGLAGPSYVRTQAAEPKSGSTAWPPQLQDLNGRDLLPAGQAFKALVVIFVLPDCPIGNSYVPELNRLYQSFSGRGIHLVVVHADTETTLERAREHAREFALAMPVARDAKHAWVRKAGATVAPEAAVFSPQGELVYRGRIDNRYAALGKRRTVVTEHDLNDVLDAIAIGQPIRQSRTEAIGCLIPEPPHGQ